MSHFITNPGTGPTPAGDGSQARASLAALIKATGLSDVTVKFLHVADDGRYDFRLRRQTLTCEISIPALPPDRLDCPGPRLYVDGSSWWWRYAVEALRCRLLPDCPDCGGRGHTLPEEIADDGAILLRLDIPDTAKCPACGGAGSRETL